MKKKYLTILIFSVPLGFLLGKLLKVYTCDEVTSFVLDTSLFFLIFILLIAVHLLDQWSTKTLFAVNWLYLHNKELRENEVKNDIKEGIEKYELNPVVRWFIKKFGVMKGLKLSKYFLSFPILAFLLLYALFIYPGDQATYISYLLVFYIGAIYTQILRAKARKERLEKLGYDIDELIKGDKVK